jgi:hypothetical protein
MKISNVEVDVHRVWKVRVVPPVREPVLKINADNIQTSPKDWIRTPMRITARTMLPIQKTTAAQVPLV